MACENAGKGAREAVGQIVQRDQARYPVEARVEAEGDTSKFDGRASY
jgi:hypothetical protein